MSLPPFLKAKDQRVSGLIIEHRKPDEKPEAEEQDYGIETCARDLLNAVEAKDIKGIAEALKSAFDILESQPHDEYPHDESYEAQNRKAALKE